MNAWQAIVLISVGLVGHVILWTALVNRIHGLGVTRWIVDALTLTCGVALVAIPAAMFWDLRIAAGGQFSNVSVAYLALCSLMVVWSAVDRWWLRRGDRNQSLLFGNHTRVLELRATHGAKLLASGVVRCLGSLPGNEVLRVHIHEKQLVVPSLPVALDGLRIAHLSDLHMSGRLSAEYYEAVVESVNEWEPDLVAITGDIVEDAEWIDRAGEILGRLRAASGVYFVLGNHDRKTDHEGIRRVLIAEGQCDVGGRSMELTLRGEQVLIAGNELPWFPMHQEIGGDAAGLRLLLAHGPDQFAWAQQRGFHLMLAGHNHGGQVCFPLIGAIVAPSVSGTRYAGGIFRRGDTLLHVSRGTGSLSPLRWNCPPEIALLTLRTADGR
ncbi:MAG: metallophosphoesterase [Pirellulales bacterium]